MSVYGTGDMGYGAMQLVSVTFYFKADIVQPLAQMKSLGRIDQNAKPVVADIEQFTRHPLDMQPEFWHRKGSDPNNLSFFGVFFRHRPHLWGLFHLRYMETNQCNFK